ncbi:TetR/AcrR family transcriptional regulator [Chitinophaga sp. GbtcB8]|uniref:TetR/AcrR family transcriptional regulator n=1 Tax=Chitinophaga sp. GbtcB8 TaxID=2824753 RepID=UPI001C2F8F91|nr:TetR/AcrR family transcriptional regulator [Chitinophaga sp. GbtcB8]
MLSKAERTKQFILETAGPIFNQKGISGASIDDVLDAAKVTKGCLYGHFQSKEDLSLQVVDHLLENNEKKLFTIISKGKTAKAKVFAFLDFYKDPLDTYVKGGCPLFNIAVESDDHFPEIKEKVGAVLRQGQELFVSILQQGIKDGEFSDELNPPVYAFKAVAAVEGAVVLCRAMNTSKPMHGLIRSLKAELERYAV